MLCCAIRFFFNEWQQITKVKWIKYTIVACCMKFGLFYCEKKTIAWCRAVCKNSFFLIHSSTTNSLFINVSCAFVFRTIFSEVYSNIFYHCSIFSYGGIKVIHSLCTDVGIFLKIVTLIYSFFLQYGIQILCLW